MPRYFFDVNECGLITSDEEGSVHADLAAARVQAIKVARGILAAEVAMGRLCLACTVEIRDPARTLIDTVPFRYAIEITGNDGRSDDAAS